ncbi:MAG: hypothetical protein Q9174_005019, partial [Haloplaca sp. 1 TL-2023]
MNCEGNTEEAEPQLVDEHGDLLLHVNFQQSHVRQYRVVIASLRSHSTFFDALLDDTKFSEGIAVQARLANLRANHVDMSSVPPCDLPRVTVSDVAVGRANPSSNSVAGAFRLFLDILHGRFVWPASDKAVKKPDFLALLAHYAEAFGAVACVKSCIAARLEHLLPLDLQNPTGGLKEEKVRQKIYIGLVMGLSQWVRTYSASLIIHGSFKWQETYESDQGLEDGGLPWENLSGGVE